jgi:hypothetical protein
VAVMLAKKDLVRVFDTYQFNISWRVNGYNEMSEIPGPRMCDLDGPNTQMASRLVLDKAEMLDRAANVHFIIMRPKKGTTY